MYHTYLHPFPSIPISRVTAIRAVYATRFSSDSLPLFVAARISQKLLPVVGRELQVAG